MQNPLCAFQTFTVVSEEADITTTQNNPLKLAKAQNIFDEIGASVKGIRGAQTYMFFHYNRG